MGNVIEFKPGQDRMSLSKGQRERAERVTVGYLDRNTGKRLAYKVFINDPAAPALVAQAKAELETMGRVGVWTLTWEPIS